MPYMGIAIAFLVAFGLHKLEGWAWAKGLEVVAIVLGVILSWWTLAVQDIATNVWAK
jgi:hypothetical protein